MSEKNPADPATPAKTTAEPQEHEDEAKGLPHSDRHEAETLAGRLEKEGPAETKVK